MSDSAHASAPAPTAVSPSRAAAPRQVVLVTGSSTGFGRLTAETLARQGHTVYASMRGVAAHNAAHARDLATLAARDGLALRVVELDTGDDASVEAAVARVVAEAGRVDVLVNNVGQGSWGVAEGYTTAQVRDLFETNVFSAVRATRAVLPHMRAQRAGLLVQVSSLIGRLVLPAMVPYSAVKHAVEALAEGYRYELAALGVDSAIIEPQSHPTAGSLEKIVQPGDRDRVAAYGGFAAWSDAAYQGNDQSLRGDQAPNPQDVADAVARLVAQPFGQRPLRTLVGGPMTQLVRPVNAVTEQVQQQFLGFVGLTELAAQRPVVGAPNGADTSGAGTFAAATPDAGSVGAA